MLLRSPQQLQAYPPRLSDMLCHWAARAPDRVFLAERVADQRDWRKLTYAQTLAAVQRIGQALLDRKLSADRPVAILSDNSVDHALMTLAAMHVGVPVVPISPAYSLASKTFAKLRHMIDTVGPGLVFVADGEAFAPALQAVAPQAEIVVGGNPGTIISTAFAELCNTSSTVAVDDAAERVGPDTIAKILFSSGSTDLPKGVITTQRMMCSNQTAVAQVWPFLADEPPILVDWLPWNHVFGGSFCFNLTLFHGGTFFLDDGKPSPRLIGRTITNLREISPTMYLNVPLGYDMLLPHLERDAALRDRFFSQLNVLFYAAAVLPPALWQRLEDLAFRSRGEKVPMISAWGATETAPVVTAVHFAINQHAGSVGLPVPGCEIKMLPNNGRLELRVRGPNVTPGYWRRADLTRAAFDEDGFFRIGDTGRLVDASAPECGIAFSGRIAEDFKLASGVWVNPGVLRLRAIAAGTPVIQDAVITGYDRAEIGLLIVPSEQGCRYLCPDLPATTPFDVLLADPRVRQRVAAALATMIIEGDGSSTRPARALLMKEPLSSDGNEITDKGYVNQRAVLERRSDLVDRLYAATTDAEIITAWRGT
jgi:feruloyl-CoA synthase